MKYKDTETTITLPKSYKNFDFIIVTIKGVCKFLSTGGILRDLRYSNGKYTIEALQGGSADTRNCVPLYIIGHKIGI